MRSTIQVDLDSLWTYRRYVNQAPIAEDIDPVYAEGVQCFLEIFKKHSIKATFFVIGSDALKPEQASIIKQIADQGHEIANHSMNHLLNFNSLDDKQIYDEIKKSHDILERVSGKRVLGFRAPTFSVNESVLKVLEKLKYVYDSSVWPSFIGSLALNCAHSLLRRKFCNIAGKNIRFAHTSLGLYRPDMNNMVKTGQGKLFEIPISVIPGLRFPMHSTYVFMCGKGLFDWGQRKLKKRQISINYVFHGIDLLDVNKYGLKLPLFGEIEKRKNLCEYILKRLKSESEVIPTLDLIRKMDGSL